MARVSYHYSCGCGYTTENEERALEHSQKEGHIMDVKGNVVPSGRQAK